MRADSVVFAVSGILFGLIVGWVLGSQQTRGAAGVPLAVQQSAQAAPAQGGAPAQPAKALDAERVSALRGVAAQNPRDPQPRVELGNLYFDAEQYTEAISWYEQALALKNTDPNVSTDLGVAYYYTNQPDRALAQFDKSLAIDPKHTKTLLNVGIVRAFGKQDLNGAAAAWRQLLSIAPDSPEGQAAKKALDSLQNSHPGVSNGGK
jgi:tetratricopeptide (TPR) repeat protein